MFRILTFMAVICSFAAVSLPTQAEEGEVAATLQKKYDLRAAVMAPFDTNQDKILQRDELRAMIIGKFQQADADGDDVLSPEEQQGILGSFVENNEELYGAFAERRAKQLGNRLRNVDSNEDGSLSKAEYYNYFGNRYSAMDQDGDGHLSVEEFRTDTESRGRR